MRGKKRGRRRGYRRAYTNTAAKNHGKRKVTTCDPYCCEVLPSPAKGGKKKRQQREHQRSSLTAALTDMACEKGKGGGRAVTDHRELGDASRKEKKKGGGSFTEFRVVVTAPSTVQKDSVR